MKRITLLLLALLLLIATIPAVAQNGDYNMADKEHTISLLREYTTNDFANDPAVQRIWDATGYHVVYDFLPAEDAVGKLTLLLASAITDYDMIRVPKIDAYYQYVTSGILLDLTERIESSNYYNNAFTDEERSVFDKVKMDGKLYGLVSPSSQSVQDANFIRKDWLDAMNMESPKTTDDLLNVLRAIKENYPEAKPLSIAQDLYPGLIAGAFGVDVDFKEVDGTLTTRFERADDMKAYLAYMSQLFAEGLLDKEFIVNSGAVVDEQIFNGYVGAWTWNVWGIGTAADTFAQYQPDGSFEMLSPITKDGVSELYGASGFNEFWVIPLSVADGADKVFDYLNKFYIEENYVAIYDGYEGVHYTMEDGSMKPIQPAFGTDCSNGSFVFGSGSAWTLKYWTVRLQKNPSLYFWYMAYQDMLGDTLAGDPMDFAAPIASRVELGDQLNAFASENITKFICGQRDIDEYDQFLADWYAFGGKVVMDDINAWYQ